MADEIEDLKAEVERLNRELAAAQAMIRRAKNIDPVQKPTFRRVLQLAREACLDIRRVAGGWELSMGDSLKRRFRFLKEIWVLLLQESWSLLDLFTPEPKQQRKAKPRKPKRYPPLAPWLPFVSRAEAPHTDDVDTSAPPTEDWAFNLY